MYKEEGFLALLVVAMTGLMIAVLVGRMFETHVPKRVPVVAPAAVPTPVAKPVVHVMPSEKSCKLVRDALRRQVVALAKAGSDISIETDKELYALKEIGCR